MNAQTIDLLNRLAALSTVSAAGYSVAAESARNRGLKIILYAFAREREDMARELGREIQRLGGKPRRRPNLLAGLHRGWINLKATMTIGAENAQSMILDEVARGERIADSRFKSALSVQMPEETRQLVAGLGERVEAAREQIGALRGEQGEQLVVRLVDHPADVERAIQELKGAGFQADKIATRSAGDFISERLPGARHGTVRETVATTALLVGAGGALLGVVMAILSLATQQFDASARVVALLTAIGWPVLGAGVGMLFGAIIGGTLGQGSTEEDLALTADSIEHGDTLVTVRTEPARARTASEIMYRVNVAARSGHTPEPARIPASVA
jgi:uncharacterized protein (TIGR02284 family)